MSLGWENEWSTLEVQLWVLLDRTIRLVTVCNLDYLAPPRWRLTEDSPGQAHWGWIVFAAGRNHRYFLSRILFCET